MKSFKVLTALLVAGVPGAAFAESLTWTGDGANRDFTAADNWSDTSGQSATPDPGDADNLGDRLVIGEEARGIGGPILSGELTTGLFENITVSAPGLTINTVDIPPTLTIDNGTLQALEFNTAEAQGTMGRVVQKDGDFLVSDFRMSNVKSGFSGGSSEYRLEDGYLSASFAQIGDDGDAEFRQEGGRFDAGNFFLGGASVSSSNGLIVTGRAEYHMSGGVLNTGSLGRPDGVDIRLNRNGTRTEIGAGSPALFVLKGGTHQVAIRPDFLTQFPLVVGGAVFNSAFSGEFPDDPAKHLGEYIIRGDGHLVVDHDAIVGEGVRFSSRDPGNGLIRQRSGTADIGHNLILGGYGEFGSGQGRYRISEGALDVAGDIIIGETGPNGVGTGRMSVTGGTVTAGDIRIAPASRSTGEPADSPDNELFIGEGGFGTNTTTFGTVFAEDVIVGGGATAGDNPTAELRVNGGGLLNANSVEARDGGLVTGTGRIQTGRLAMFQRSFLTPGQSPGALEITGDLLLGDGSTLMLEIAGRNPGDWDILEIGGSLFAEAGAAISIDFLDGFFPEAGDSFDFFNVAGDTTQFDTLLADGLIDLSIEGDSDLAFDFSSDGVSFRADTTQPSPVPLPASAILLLSTLSGLGTMRLCTRRRQNST